MPFSDHALLITDLEIGTNLQKYLGSEMRFNRGEIASYVKRLKQFSLYSDISSHIRAAVRPQVKSRLLWRPPKFYTDPYEQNW